jgi:hypothetical protein
VGVGTVNSDTDAPGAVTVRLPSGTPVKIEVAGPAGDDGMASVGLRDLNLDSALGAIAEIGSLVMDKVKAARPARATVQLRLAFTVESGKLTAMWVGGKGEAALTVTLEWEDSAADRTLHPPDPPAEGFATSDG